MNLFEMMLKGETLGTFRRALAEATRNAYQEWREANEMGWGWGYLDTVTSDQVSMETWEDQKTRTYAANWARSDSGDFTINEFTEVRRTVDFVPVTTVVSTTECIGGHAELWLGEGADPLDASTVNITKLLEARDVIGDVSFADGAALRAYALLERLENALFDNK